MILAKSPSVFARSEDDEKLLLLQTHDSELPPLFLMTPPGAALWAAIGDGADLHEVLRRAEDSGVSADQAMGIVDVLARNRLISCDPSVAAGLPVDDAADEILLDPWRYQFSKTTLERPWFALWELTDACPRRGVCSYCYRPDTTGAEPDFADRGPIIDELLRCEVPFVTLLGGEPMCYEGIYDVIARLRAGGRFVKMISNGVMIDEAAAQRLADVGLNQIALSMDGLDAATSDASRGAGAYEKVLEALERVKPLIPKVSISLTVSSAVFPQLDDLQDFCRRLGVNEVYLSPLRAVDRARYPEGVTSLSSGQMARVHEIAARHCRDGLNIVSLKECSCGRSSFVIHADGGLSPCPFGSAVFGNILDDGLAAAWSRMNDAAIRLEGSSTCFRHFDVATAPPGGPP